MTEMTAITLAPMTAADLDAFIDAEVADLADERVREGTWPRCRALDCARDELATVVDWERQAATAERQRLWVARAPTGEPVGWLWVKLGPPPPDPAATRAFLCQLTVARGCRHRGYGRSILAALESRLLAEGYAELQMNVCEGNLVALQLYAAAGYEADGRYPTMRRLRKRLGAADGMAAPVPAATVPRIPTREAGR